MWRIFRRRQREQDLQDELAAHLAMDTQDRIESGDPPDAARHAAWRDFGNVTRIAEDTRTDALITDVELMDQALSRVVAPRELNTALVSIFAFVALSLAIVGVYGVMSYSVARRSLEIGVRVALGAQRRGVLLLVLHQGLRLVILGVLIGLAGAVALTRWMSTLLFEVDPTDPLT